MMRVLFIKEIRDAFLSWRFWLILAICLIIIPLGVEVSLKGYQTRLQSYREAVRSYQEQTTTPDDILQKGGAKAFAPPSPLSFLSLGLELIKPNVAETQFRTANPPAVMRFNNNQGQDNLYEFFYGPLDLVSIVAVVMTFFAIIITFGAVAGEKEQGTLCQVLSNSVPRAKFILAKALAGGVVLVIPFLLALLLILAIISVQENPLTHGDWTLIICAVLMAVLLIGAFLSLGLLVSGLAKQAAPALVTLILVWTFLYGVYPRLASSLAQLIYPVKSESRVALEKSQIRRNIEKQRDEEIDRLTKSLPDVHRNTEIEAIKEGMKKEDEIRDRFRAQLEENLRTIERDVEERRKARNALALNILRLSPVSSFVRSMAELGRTGWLEYGHFIQDVRQYEGMLNIEIFNKQEVRKYGMAGIDASHGVDQITQAPVFTYAWTPHAEVIQNVLPDIVILVLFNLVFFAAAFLAFMRYDAR